jgi:hypothetical protein
MVTKDGLVRDHTRKSDLALPHVSTKTKRVLYRTLEHVPCAVSSPVSLPQEFVNEFDVQTPKAALYLDGSICHLDQPCSSAGLLGPSLPSPGNGE